MNMIHQPEVHSAIKQRVASLRPDATRHWGKMTVDQMLWHVNLPLREAVGDYVAPGKHRGMTGSLLLWLVLRVPWGKGAPTRPDAIAKERYDFEEQRQLCLTLIDQLAAKDINGPFPPSPNFGPMSGVSWSRLQAKHLDHHLRQFGA